MAPAAPGSEAGSRGQRAAAAERAQGLGGTGECELLRSAGAICRMSAATGPACAVCLAHVVANSRFICATERLLLTTCRSCSLPAKQNSDCGAPACRSGGWEVAHTPVRLAPPLTALHPKPLPPAHTAPVLAARHTTAPSCKSRAATTRVCRACGRRSRCKRCVWLCFVLLVLRGRCLCLPNTSKCLRCGGGLVIAGALAWLLACLLACMLLWLPAALPSMHAHLPRSMWIELEQPPRLIPTLPPQLPAMQSAQSLPNVPNSAPLWLPHPPSGGGGPAQGSTASGGSGASAAAGLAHGWGPLPARPPGVSSNEGGSSGGHGGQGGHAARDRLRLEQLVEADW